MTTTNEQVEVWMERAMKLASVYYDSACNYPELMNISWRENLARGIALAIAEASETKVSSLSQSVKRRLEVQIGSETKVTKESIAKLVYKAMIWAAKEPTSNPPKWAEDGNADAQYEARRISKAILKLFTKKEKT